MSIKKIPVDTQLLIQSSSHIINFTTALQALVYNSIDAESTSIAVRLNLREYSIQVIDNGSGVSKKDMEVIGNRYMTSKLTHIEDVQSILKTYGYRGETLASLIVLSEECIFTSRTIHSVNTYCKIHKGSNISNVELTNDRPSPGLTVHIKGFMHKLPIRRNNLNIPAELHDVKKAIQCIALIHQSISFSVRDDTNNSVVIVKMPKCKTLQQSLKNIYETDVGSMLQELQVEKNNFKVKAYISKDLSINLDLRVIYLNKYPLINSKLHKIVNALLLKCNGSNNSRTCGAKYMKFQDYKNADAVYKNENKSKPSYIILISCPYNCYDLSCMSNKTLVEFHDWSRITNLLEKLVNFFNDAVKLIPIKTVAETLPSTKLKENALQGKELNRIVTNIVDKVLKSDKRKFGVSQVPNAVKGKIAKRLKVKKKVQSISKLKVTQTETIDGGQKSKDFVITKPESSNNGKTLGNANEVPNFVQQKKVEVCVPENVLRETPFEMPFIPRCKPKTKINEKKHNRKSIVCSYRTMLKYKKIANEAKDLMKKERDRCLGNFKEPTAIQRTCIRETIIIRKKRNSSGNNYKIKSFKTNYDLIKPILQISDDSFYSFQNNSNVFYQQNIQTLESYHPSGICHDLSNGNNPTSVTPRGNRYSENNYMYPISKNMTSLTKCCLQKKHRQKSKNIIDKLIKSYLNVSYVHESHQNASDKTCVNTYRTGLGDEIKTENTKRIYKLGNVTNCKKKLMKHNQCFINRRRLQKFYTPSYDIQWSHSESPVIPPKKYGCNHYTNRPINTKQHRSKNTFTNKIKMDQNCASNNLQNNNPSSKLFEGLAMKKFEAIGAVPEETAVNIYQMSDSMKKCSVYNQILRNTTHNASFKLVPYSNCNNWFKSVPNKSIRNLIKLGNQKIQTSMATVTQVLNENKDVDEILLTYNSHITRNQDALEEHFKVPEVLKESNDEFTVHSDSNSEMVRQSIASSVNICNNDKFIARVIENSSKLNCVKPNSNIEVIFISNTDDRGNCEAIISNDLNPADLCEPVIGSSDLFEDSIIAPSNDENNNEIVIQASNVSSTKATYNIDINGKVNVSVETMLIENTVSNDQNKLDVSKSNAKENPIITNEFNGKVNVSVKTTLIENIVSNDQNKLEVSKSNTKENPINTNENECFQIKKRQIYVPKGMSPIFQGPSIRNLVKTNNENHSTADQYYNEKMYDNFVSDVNKFTDVYETNAPFVDEVTDERIRNACYRLRELVSKSTFDKKSLDNTVILKQVDDKFLAVILKDSADDANFYVILFDQHAVHERITLEKLYTEYKTDDGIWKSKRCDPFEIKLSEFDACNLAYYKDKFMLHGLQWEYSEKDSDSIMVTEIPICLLKRDEQGADYLKGLIRDLIDELLLILKNTKGCGVTNTRTLLNIVNMEACRSAIKFGQNLSKLQCVKLIEDLSKCNTPFQCAHGRPSLAVLIKLRKVSSNYKVDKQKAKHLLK